MISSLIKLENKMLVVLLVVLKRIEKGLERLVSSKSLILNYLPLVAGAGIEPATS